METYLYIIGALAVIVFGIFYWLGMLTTMKIKETVFKGGIFIYTDYRGNIKNVNAAFVKHVIKDRDEYRKTMVRPITLPCLGIYYDDPYNLVDPEECRATIGFLAPYRSEEMIKYFTQKGLKVKVLPQSNSIHGSFPYRCSLSFMLGALKYYPSSLKYMGRHSSKFRDNIDMDEAGGCIELMEDNRIKYYLPLDHKREFFLTPHPNPEWKDPSKYQNFIKEGERNSKKTD